MIIVPDQNFNPNFVEKIDSGTKLAPGVSISKFLGSRGDPCSLSTIDKYKDDQDARKQLARNLYLHAELFRSINGNVDYFKDVRLIVVEGVYRGGPIESVGGENKDKEDGKLVAYRVVDENGDIDYERTFDLAEYWKDFTQYDKLILEYDQWDPSGKLNAQVAVLVPEVPESFEVSFGKQVETRFNGQLLSKNELLEVLEK